MTERGPIAPDAVAAAVGSLVGLPVTKARIGWGTFVTIDFGELRQSPVGDYIGDFHLWVYGGMWAIIQDGVVTATADDSRLVMEQAVTAIEGAKSIAASVGEDGRRLQLDFAPGPLRLIVEPCNEDDMEDWKLYLPSGSVIVVGPGESIRAFPANEIDPLGDSPNGNGGEPG